MEHDRGNMSPMEENVLAICKSFDFEYARVQKSLDKLELNPLNQQPEQDQTVSSSTLIISPLSHDTRSQRTIINPAVPFIRNRNDPSIDIQPCKGFKRCRGSDGGVEEDFNPDSWPHRSSIMWTLENSYKQPDLIGDFSTSFILPYTEGRHQDLKIISPETLQHLLKGAYMEQIGSFKVIDCRYPYEFEGGHMTGAVNMYTREQLVELLKHHQTPDSHIVKRDILIFHCDISGDRGPIQYRHLRRLDRKKHEFSYPFLSFPEIYFLGGGYKSFFEQFPEMCTPMAYIEMLHPKHTEDFKRFRDMLMPRSAKFRARQCSSKNVKTLW